MKFVKHMEVKIAPSWQAKLSDEFKKDYFSDLVAFVKNEYQNHQVFPSGQKIFNAFEHCPFDQVKVVIIGQDPYHGLHQANGLSFSVEKGVKIPPSLVNIFKEVSRDLQKPMPAHGDLERWADQGVLLLNATLTVRAHTPGSHQNKGWEIFTDAVIRKVSEEKQHVVFMLWGAYAQKKSHLIDGNKHLILQSAHPSPFSVHRGFSGNKHFSKANTYLEAHKKGPIDW